MMQLTPEESLSIGTALWAMDFFGRLDAYDMLWWRTDGEYAPITMFVKCSDTFTWGTADLEEIGPDDIEKLMKAQTNVMEIDRGGNQYYSYWVPILYCAMKRGMRPMPLMEIPEELKPLFNACGPERTSNDFPY